jgi:hypothetical protein
VVTVDSEAVVAVKAPQAQVIITVVAAMVVVARLLSIESQYPKEYAPFIGPMEPVIVASIVRSSMK